MDLRMKLVVAAVAGLVAFFLFAVLLKAITGNDEVAGWGAVLLGFGGVPILVLQRWPRRPGNGKLMPESLYVVTIDASQVSVVDPQGLASRMAWDDLDEIAIETNSSGPWGMDLWWVLSGRVPGQPCAFPNGATGEQELIEWLESMPGTDMAQVIAAMGCTHEARFLVWRRPPGPGDQIADGG
jgi:hypothetical protein